MDSRLALGVPDLVESANPEMPQSHGLEAFVEKQQTFRLALYFWFSQGHAAHCPHPAQGDIVLYTRRPERIPERIPELVTLFSQCYHVQDACVRLLTTNLNETPQ